MKTFSKLLVVTVSIWASEVVFESRHFSFKSHKTKAGWVNFAFLHLKCLLQKF